MFQILIENSVCVECFCPEITFFPIPLLCKVKCNEHWSSEDAEEDGMVQMNANRDISEWSDCWVIPYYLNNMLQALEV